MSNLEIRSKKEALEKGLTTYYTGKPCKRGHIVERHTTDGHCVECRKICHKINEARRYDVDPDQRKRRAYRERYGLSMEEALDMKAGGCEVCGSTESLKIDHDHISGSVRGVLCHHCNVALGHLDDDPNRIERLADYMRKHIQPVSIPLSNRFLCEAI